MYSLVRAVLRERGINKVWSEVNIANMTLTNIFKRYYSGYIVLSAVGLDHLQYVDINTLKQSKYTVTSQPFYLWLQALGNKKLDATEVEPTFSEGRVGYIDAWQAGYQMERVYPPSGIPDSLRPNSELGDGLLNKIGMPSSYLSSALVTVNGFLHRSALTRNGLQIQGAGRTLDISQNNQVGLLSFSKVGNIQIVDIKDANIKSDHDVPLYRSCYVHLGIDLTGKSLLFSLGGFLNTAGFEVINPESGLISLNLRAMNIHKRLLESIPHIDLESLDLYLPDNMPGSLSKDQVTNDPTLRKYLQLSQTFFVVIDTPSLSLGFTPVGSPNLFGLYETPIKPTYPMIDHLGRMPEYNTTRQGYTWVIRTGELYYKDYSFETGAFTTRTGQRLPSVILPDGYNKQIGHLLEIRSMRPVT